MTTIIPAATLSTKGWVTTVAEKIDALLSQFFCSDRLQTSIYGDNVASFQYILEQNASNPEGAALQIRETLTTYLMRYYPQGVVVDTSVALSDPTASQSTMTLTLAVSFIENGVTYQAGSEVTSINGQFVNFINLNNS